MPPTYLGPWLHRMQPAGQSRESSGPTVQLYCFPHAGGAASSFAPLAPALARRNSPQVEVIAVQYPGRHERFGEPCIEDLRELADQAAAELHPHTGGPFALFGHSMGATVAFEVALRLERAGRDPLALFASGHGAPGLQTGPPPAHLDDETLLANVRRLGETDPRLLGNQDLLALVFPAIRADYTAVHGYRFREDSALRSRVSALIGESDPQVSHADARAWARHTSGPFDLKIFPGRHFYLRHHTDELADYVTRIMARALAGRGSTP